MADQDGHLCHLQPMGSKIAGQDGLQPHSTCSQWDSRWWNKMAANATCSQWDSRWRTKMATYATGSQ